jgi:hypothetical protein
VESIFQITGGAAGRNFGSPTIIIWKIIAYFVWSVALMGQILQSISAVAFAHSGIL